MKTKQLVVRSAVTLVATGLTLLSSGNSQASGRGPSGMRMGGSHEGRNYGAIHQGISNRTISRGHGANDAIGRIGIENRGPNSGRRAETATQMRGRDDRGGHREHGDDKGGNAGVTRGERQPADDYGRHRERGDDKGGGR